MTGKEKNERTDEAPKKPKPESRPEPKPDLKPEPRPEPRPDLKPDVSKATHEQQPAYVDHSSLDSTQMYIVDGTEKLEYTKNENFKNQIEKVAAKGEVLNFTIKVPNPCMGEIKVTPVTFKFKPYTMVSTETKYPSSSDLKIGTYFDALVPMDEPSCPNKQEICKQSPYRWVDITVPREIATGEHLVTIAQGGSSVSVKVTIKDFTMPLNPSMPFRVPISNWATMLAHCPKDEVQVKKRWGRGSETKTLDTINNCKKNFELSDIYQKALRENRMEPYDNGIVNDVQNKEYFDDVVSDCRNSSVGLPSVKGLDNVSEVKEVLDLQRASEYQKKKGIKSWFYTYDEPDLDNNRVLQTLIKRLERQKKHAPNVSRMVTTTYNPELDVDIYCPVVDQWDQPDYPKPDAYKGKDVWLYSSCMAHGCCSRTPGACGKQEKSGTPDFMIDRPAVDQMAFFAQGYKYQTQGLLYYNAGEHYGKKDPWKDTYDFGGNGDGVLMYPLTGPMNGKQGKFGCTSDAVAPSVRMKLFRQASQNYEWMKHAPDQERMKAEVDKLVRNTKDWSHNSEDYERLKEIAFP